MLGALIVSAILSMGIRYESLTSSMISEGDDTEIEWNSNDNNYSIYPNGI